MLARHHREKIQVCISLQSTCGNIQANTTFQRTLCAKYTRIDKKKKIVIDIQQIRILLHFMQDTQRGSKHKNSEIT